MPSQNANPLACIDCHFVVGRCLIAGYRLTFLRGRKQRSRQQGRKRCKRNGRRTVDRGINGIYVCSVLWSNVCRLLRAPQLVEIAKQKIGLRSERTSFGTAGAGAAGEAVTTAASTPVAALASESIASRERARKSKEDHDHENAHIPRQRCSRLAREGPGNDKYTHVCVCSTYTHASEHELVEEGACLCSDCCNLISSASRARF